MKWQSIRPLVGASVAMMACLGAVDARGDLLSDAQRRNLEASPCAGAMDYLVDQYRDVEGVAKSFELIAASVVDPPESYRLVNPWRVDGGEALLRRMVDFFTEWCTFLPGIEGDQDNGLLYIQGFAWLYYHNAPAQDFVQGRDPLDPSKALETGLWFTTEFSRQRGAFMSGPDSVGSIQAWIDDPRIEIEDYQRQRTDEYRSWNDFFARELRIDAASRTIPSRPVTMPGRDYVVSSPTDCIMNPLVQVLTANDGVVQRRYLENPLQYDTVLDVKGIPLSMADLLAGVPEGLRRHFVGGSGLACILMPNTYHRFHAPVSGTIRHAAVVTSGTYGYPDWPNWVQPSGNVAGPGTDFSQFQRFQRGVVIIQMEYAGLAPGEVLTGYVASIPVGLDTIGSVVLAEHVQPGAPVERGFTELGYFQYGGSLNILLFSTGLVTPAVQTRMGNQIGIINVGTAPAVH